MQHFNLQIEIQTGALSATILVNNGFINSSFVSMGGLHRHPLWEIHFILEGKNKVRLEHSSLLVDSGDILLVPAELPHAIIPVPDGSFHRRAAFWLAPGDGILSALKGQKTVVILKDVFQGRSQVERIQLELSGKLASQTEQLQARFSCLLLDLMRNFSGETLETTETINPQEPSRAVLIEEYLTQNFHTNCTAAQLADALHLSRRQLARLFLQLYGKPFRKILQEIRLGMAIYYLEETEIPMEEIAEQVGYGSKSAFYHAYCNAYGQPPGLLRDEALKQKEAP